LVPRPKNPRIVSSIPTVTYFKPAGIPLRLLSEVCISVEEAEAIRLKDIEGLEQEQCAEKMNISRPTFQRVLGSARQKIADALLKGKAIRIEGGVYELAAGGFHCPRGRTSEQPTSDVPRSCPVCSEKVAGILPGTGNKQANGGGTMAAAEKPAAGFGRGGRMKGARAGAGPEGNCVCPGCGTLIPHQRGVPCYNMSCPSCGAKMTRK